MATLRVVPALRWGPRRYGASRGDQPVAPTSPLPPAANGSAWRNHVCAEISVWGRDTSLVFKQICARRPSAKWNVSALRL